MNPAPSRYTRYRQMVVAPLQFPLKGDENRPVYDAAGKLVSIPLHAPMFVACANLVQEIASNPKILYMIAERPDEETPFDYHERAKAIFRTGA